MNSLSAHQNKFVIVAFSALLVAILGPMSANGRERRTPAPGAETIELPIAAVLVPERGYDDNDPSVKLVIHGTRPNACYSIGETRADFSEDGRTIEVRQFANKMSDTLCSSQQELPPHLAMLGPFNVEVDLKSLAAGTYEIRYRSQLHKQRFESRRLEVASAPADRDIDNYPYALVSSASVPSVVPRGSSLQLTLQGALTSSCTDLEQVKVSPVGNTLVVLPLLKVRKGVICMQVMRPFQRTIDLGERKESGLTLVHVRSVNGEMHNQVVEVAE